MKPTLIHTILITTRTKTIVLRSTGIAFTPRVNLRVRPSASSPRTTATPPTAALMRNDPWRIMISPQPSTRWKDTLKEMTTLWCLTAADRETTRPMGIMFKWVALCLLRCEKDHTWEISRFNLLSSVIVISETFFNSIKINYIMPIAITVLKCHFIFVLRTLETEFLISTRPPMHQTTTTFSQRCLTRLLFIEKVTWTSCKGNSSTRRRVHHLILYSFSAGTHSFSVVLKYCPKFGFWHCYKWEVNQRSCVCWFYVINANYCNAFSRDRRQGTASTAADFAQSSAEANWRPGAKAGRFEA